MKNLKSLLLLAIVSQMFLASCKKDLIDKYEASKTNNTMVAKSVKEIKAPSTFNWNTSNSVSFTFKGIAGDARKSTLTVLSEDKSVLFQKLQKASENYTGVIELPAHVGKITVLYNGISTELPISSNKFEIELK